MSHRELSFSASSRLPTLFSVARKSQQQVLEGVDQTTSTLRSREQDSSARMLATSSLSLLFPVAKGPRVREQRHPPAVLGSSYLGSHDQDNLPAQADTPPSGQSFVTETPFPVESRERHVTIKTKDYANQPSPDID